MIMSKLNEWIYNFDQRLKNLDKKMDHIILLLQDLKK